MKKFFIYFSLAVAGLVVLFAVRKLSAPSHGRLVVETSPEQSKIGGPFSLIDQNGHPVTEADYKGRYMLVFFGYTFCPDVCPTALTAISSALNVLGDDAKNISPLFISVDPKRDTPEMLKDFIGNFDARITALTGTEAQISAVAKAYKAYYSVVKEDGADEKFYLMNHSAYIYLMGPDGKLLTLFGHQRSPQEMASKIRTFL